MNTNHDETLRQLTGAWRLVSSEFNSVNGNVMHPWGEDAHGLAIFHPSGYMSAQLMRKNRANFAGDNQALGSPQEIEQAFQGYVAYYGRCELDVEKQMITTLVEGSMYPNWIGGEQVRYYQLSGDQLVLRTPPITIGDELFTGVLSWRRL